MCELICPLTPIIIMRMQVNDPSIGGIAAFRFVFKVVVLDYARF